MASIEAFLLRVVVFLASLVEGVILGLAQGSLPLLLHGQVSLMELGLFMGVVLPRGLKCCLGPWNGRMPKMMLLLSWMAIGGLLTGSATLVEDAIESGEIWMLFGVFCGLVTLTVVAEVALESWMTQRRMRLHSAQTTGLNLGAVTSCMLFLPLRKPRALFPLKIPLAENAQLFSLSNLMQSMSAVAFLLAGCFLIPLENHEARIRRVASIPLAPDKSIWDHTGVRSLQWLLFLGRLPFVAFEFLTPLKLLAAGLTPELLAATRLLDCIPGFISGAIVVHHSDPKATWIKAYVFRLVIGASLTVFIIALPQNFTLPAHFRHLGVYLMITAASVFAGNLMFVSQSVLVEQWMEMQSVEQRMRPCVKSVMTGLHDFASSLWRVIAICAADLMSHRVCYRLGQRTPDVPCPLSPPLGSASNNLCTDAQGECRIELDGFATVVYSTLAAGVVLGFTFTESLRRLPIEKAREN